MELTGQEKAFSNVIGSCRIMEQCVSMVEAQKDYLSAPMVVIALVQISRLAEQNRLQRNWAESPLAERALPILTSKLRGRCDEWDPRALSMAMLALANDTTVIVPDRGLPLTKADLQQQHDMLSVLFEKMKELTREGFNGDDLLRIGLTADYDAVWGDPEEFVQETYRGMWAHTYDMGGYI